MPFAQLIGSFRIIMMQCVGQPICSSTNRNAFHTVRIIGKYFMPYGIHLIVRRKHGNGTEILAPITISDSHTTLDIGIRENRACIALIFHNLKMRVLKFFTIPRLRRATSIKQESCRGNQFHAIRHRFYGIHEFVINRRSIRLVTIIGKFLLIRRITNYCIKLLHPLLPLQ